jgi:hypothetical protein
MHAALTGSPFAARWTGAGSLVTVTVSLAEGIFR